MPGKKGPSTGISYDVRKTHPYLVYDELDFDISTGGRGEN